VSIHLLNQPDPDGPIDAERLSAEFQAGLESFMDAPLSQAHLAALALSAQASIYQPGCSQAMRTLLLDFLGWCSQHAQFGVEIRKLLAQQGAAYRERAEIEAHGFDAGMKENGVQTPGQEGA
jgi:hypothetical protein